MEKKCNECNQIIIEDLEKYIEKYPNEIYCQCPNPLCGKIQLIVTIK